MKISLKENTKCILIAIFTFVGWCLFAIATPHVIELILDNLEIFIVFLLFLGIFHLTRRLIIKRDFIEVRNILLILLIIFLCLYSAVTFTEQKKTLPDGTIMGIHRLTKEIAFKPLGSNVYYIVTPSDYIIVRDVKSNEELSSFQSPYAYDRIYETFNEYP